MADAWGGAFGSAWGVSFGAGVAPAAGKRKTTGGLLPPHRSGKHRKRQEDEILADRRALRRLIEGQIRPSPPETPKPKPQPIFISAPVPIVMPMGPDIAALALNIQITAQAVNAVAAEIAEIEMLDTEDEEFLAINY